MAVFEGTGSMTWLLGCFGLMAWLGAAACSDEKGDAKDPLSEPGPSVSAEPEPEASDSEPSVEPAAESEPGEPSPGEPAEPAPVAPVAQCGGVGTACDAIEDCCEDDGLVCQQLGMCCAPGKGGNNVNCAYDEDCCSGTCGVTQEGKRGCCSADEAACRSDNDCCTNRECGLDLGAGLTACCTSLGNYCEEGTVCCGGGRCGSACLPFATGTGCVVTNDVCCLERGASCYDDSQCCSDQGTAECDGGRCCGGLGATCTTTDECCNSMECVDGKCDF